MVAERNGEIHSIEVLEIGFVWRSSRFPTLDDVALAITGMRQGNRANPERHSRIEQDRLVGAVGFEPTDGGIKIRCLTTWRRPNMAERTGGGRTTRPVRGDALTPSRPRGNPAWVRRLREALGALAAAGPAQLVIPAFIWNSYKLRP